MGQWTSPTLGRINGAMKTLARKPQSQNPIELPLTWRESVQETLSQTFYDECDAQGLSFDVLGATFPDELLLCLSLVQADRPEIAPCTLMLSADIEKNTAPEKLLKTLIDQSGVFFENFFQTSEEDKHELYQARWLDEKHGDQFFYSKVSRENVRLTLEANKWLEE